MSLSLTRTVRLMTMMTKSVSQLIIKTRKWRIKLTFFTDSIDHNEEDPEEY